MTFINVLWTDLIEKKFEHFEIISIINNIKNKFTTEIDMKSFLSGILLISLVYCPLSAVDMGMKNDVSNSTDYITGFVNCGTLNVRTGPWSRIIGKIYRGHVVKVTGQSEDKKWYRISFNDSTAYVYKRYVSMSSSGSTGTESTSSLREAAGSVPFEVLTTADPVIVRGSPWERIVGKLGKNETLTIVETRGDWYRFQFGRGSAWVHSSSVVRKSPPPPPVQQPTNPPEVSGKYTPNNRIGNPGDSKGVPQDMNGVSFNPKKYPNVERWRSIVEKYFKPNRVDLALYIIYRESRGNPNAVNSSSKCTGLFQQHPKYWDARAKGVGCAGAPATDPEANIAASAALSKQGDNWKHWTTAPK